VSAGCLEGDEGELVLEHEGLAVKLARRMGMLDEDGLQAARLGVLQALRRFDPGRGTKFSTYAAFWILAELQRELADRQIVGINTKALRRRKRVTELRESLGPASTEELAAVAGVSVDQVRAFEELGELRVSDLWGHGPGRILLEQLLPGDEGALDEAMAEQQGRAALDDALATLGRRRPRLAWIIRRRLTGTTLETIGRELGVSRTRVGQLEQQALEWLRRRLLARGLE
jgi:RNA polymerase sigma factor (sigma-70 family)